MKNAEPFRVVAVRMPADLVERIDAYAERRRGELPGLRLTFSDAARELITAALAAADGRRRPRKN